MFLLNPTHLALEASQQVILYHYLNQFHCYSKLKKNTTFHWNQEHNKQQFVVFHQNHSLVPSFPLCTSFLCQASWLPGPSGRCHHHSLHGALTQTSWCTHILLSSAAAFLSLWEDEAMYNINFLFPLTFQINCKTVVVTESCQSWKSEWVQWAQRCYRGKGICIAEG